MIKTKELKFTAVIVAAFLTLVFPFGSAAALAADKKAPEAKAPAARAPETKPAAAATSEIKLPGTLLLSLNYGSGDGELGLPLNATAGEESISQSPSAFDAGASGDCFVVDTVKKSVFRTGADKKTSIFLKYDSTEIGSDYVSDIVVSKAGQVYLCDAKSQMVHVFSKDAKHVVTLGEIVDRQVFRGIAAMLPDAAGNLAVVDLKDPKVVFFNVAGKLSKEYELKTPGAGYALDADGKVFTSILAANVIKLVETEKGDEKVLEYPAAGSEIADARLLGFDAAGCAYLKIVKVDQEGQVVEDAAVKFSKEGKMLKKAVLPYYNIEDQPHVMEKSHIFMKDDCVVTYRDDQKAFSLLAFELK